MGMADFIRAILDQEPMRTKEPLSLANRRAVSQPTVDKDESGLFRRRF
jgi:hypothetical protein